MLNKVLIMMNRADFQQPLVRVVFVTLCLLFAAETAVQAQCGQRRSSSSCGVTPAPQHSPDRSIRRDRDSSTRGIVGSPTRPMPRTVVQAAPSPVPPEAMPIPQLQTVPDYDYPQPEPRGGRVPAFFDQLQNQSGTNLVSSERQRVVHSLIGPVPKILAFLLFFVLQTEGFYWISRLCTDRERATRLNSLRTVACVNFGWPLLGGLAFLVAFFLVLNLAVSMNSGMLAIGAVVAGVLAAVFVLYLIVNAIYEEELIPTLGLVLLPVPLVCFVILPMCIITGYLAMGNERRDLLQEFFREMQSLPSLHEPGAHTESEMMEIQLQFIQDFEEQLPLRKRIINQDFAGMTLEERIALEQLFAGRAARLKEQAARLGSMPAQEKAEFRENKEALETHWKSFRHAVTNLTTGAGG